MRCSICGEIIRSKAVKIDNETITCEDCAEMLDNGWEPIIIYSEEDNEK